MARTKTKQITFHRLYLVDEGRRKDPTGVDWRAQLQGITSLSWEARTVDGVVYDPHLEADHVILGVHSPIKSDFMSKLDPSTESVTDVLSDEEESSEEDGAPSGQEDVETSRGASVKIDNFANSTAVLFMATGNVVALAKGSNSSPGTDAVVDFLTALLPQGPGSHWKIEPLIAPAHIDALGSRAQGAVEFSTTFSTSRGLYAPDETGGLVSYADDIANRLGADIEVKIEVKLAAESKSLTAASRLLTMIRQSMPRVNAKANRTKARVVLADGLHEELDLVAHRLAHTVDIDESVSESRRFTGLMDHLRIVSGEMESTVKVLVNGVSGEEDPTGSR